MGIQPVIERLTSEDSVAHVCAEVETWAKAERADDLVLLARALETQAEGKNREWFESVADHVEDQLALIASPGAVDAVLALSLEPRTRSTIVPRSHDVRVRAFASRLGYGQTATAFLTALDRAGERSEHRELFACWMQEVILRGTSLADDARAKRFRDVLSKAGHPLAALPLALHAVEREAPSYMPLYGDKGLGRAIESLASGAMSIRTIPPPADGAAVQATLVKDGTTAVQLSAAVKPWAEGKSGKLEAKVFALSPAVSAGALGSWLLRALPLDSTAGATRLECTRAPVESVFGPLFSAASNGGAYSSGLGGAYGRLAAWTSLAALVGATSADPIATAELAAKSTFLGFRSAGPWFHDVAWDLGALALRPDGASVAVLAATDTE